MLIKPLAQCLARGDVQGMLALMRTVLSEFDLWQAPSVL